MKDDNICYLPWVGLDITPQGEFKPCCKYANNFSGTLSEYLDSAELTSLKESFLAGEKPNGCSKCWDDEKAGHTSKRNEDWIYIFKEQVPDLNKLKVLSFPFGNSCNLACRTCDSYASSTWGVETKKLKHQLPKLVEFKHNRYYQDNNLIAQIKNLGSDITEIYFPGGEPFLAGTDEHLSLLNHYIDIGKSQNITLHYMTNLTIFPNEKFWHAWKKFKKINMQLSIDGLEKHFEYTRWPAKWDLVSDNLVLFKNALTDNPNMKLSVGYVVSIFTVYYLPEFYKWLLQNKLADSFISLLSSPVMYSIKTLPGPIKDKVAKKLTRFKFDNIVSYMYEEDLSSNFNQTTDYIEVLDQHRNQSFAETFPEFYQLIKEK